MLPLTCSFLFLRSPRVHFSFPLFLSFLPYLSFNFEHWSVVLFPSFEPSLCIRILFLSPFLSSGHSLPSTLFLCSIPLSLKIHPSKISVSSFPFCSQRSWDRSVPYVRNTPSVLGLGLESLSFSPCDTCGQENSLDRQENLTIDEHYI